QDYLRISRCGILNLSTFELRQRGVWRVTERALRRQALAPCRSATLMIRINSGCRRRRLPRYGLSMRGGHKFAIASGRSTTSKRALWVDLLLTTLPRGYLSVNLPRHWHGSLRSTHLPVRYRPG